MGFRDIQAFNLALLAKQAWRLIHHTHSLFHQVYKARYFPTCLFMEAELGHNPSYVCRSLLAARDIIRAGSQWKVGDGRRIKVAVDKWLSHSLGKTRPLCQLVSSLMTTRANGIDKTCTIYLHAALGERFWPYL